MPYTWYHLSMLKIQWTVLRVSDLKRERAPEPFFRWAIAPGRKHSLLINVNETTVRALWDPDTEALAKKVQGHVAKNLNSGQRLLQGHVLSLHVNGL